jgi:predicted glycosyltransferase involved in capsule biosynthesis
MRILFKIFNSIYKFINSSNGIKHESYISPPEAVSSKYSIGITTFDKRFETFFRPLIETIKSIRPEIEVIVMVNAPYQFPMDESYRSEMLKFLSNFPNIYPHFCSEFRSLSKLWNNELIFASNNLVLVLNDDVSILPNFFDDLDKLISENNYKSFKINGSWSHVLLNKIEISKVGWFDERLLGVGEEDGDMEFRWSRYFNSNFKSFHSDNILNFVDNSSDLRIVKHSESKYSKFNRDFINSKYQVDFVLGEKWGMYEFPMKQIIKDEDQYLCEIFFEKNKNNL